MYTHNLDPILFDFGFFIIRWYSLAYIFGILSGWWLAKKIILKKFKKLTFSFNIKELDNLITYLIISMLLGGRIGYIIFYNFGYYISNPLDTLKLWEGGMSFHGALIGIIFGTHLFAKRKKIPTFFLLDIIACVCPLGIFFGRLANFINAELVGKTTDIFWGVIFPNIDNTTRHPSQLYEAFLEGLVLLVIMNIILFRKEYRRATCSYMFLILYGFFRIISEFFREPDAQIGYLFNLASMGTVLSILMIIAGMVIYLVKK
ncbi:prolipoprotein diacylglyceryl transferase [Pelagibacteraceae bacterium]|jgi:phosphatidylglycerol:prolipoprotein diacylglycerol transferase|nr:prolipoprotein diacylglyceryl transferase [Pelagibacteraceae bacterium]|tara:strand:- start:580 stop:1359 length:780 start_codon:yes stop_codon:yes gene_type:complete